VADLIEIGGRQAGAHFLAHQGKRLGDNPPRFAHDIDFAAGF
jgi:hypothetical protein